MHESANETKPRDVLGNMMTFMATLTTPSNQELLLGQARRYPLLLGNGAQPNKPPAALSTIPSTSTDFDYSRAVLWSLSMFRSRKATMNASTHELVTKRKELELARKTNVGREEEQRLVQELTDLQKEAGRIPEYGLHHDHVQLFKVCELISLHACVM